MAWGFIIILALFIAAFLFFRIGDLFSPWLITSGVWFAILMLLQLYGDMLYPLQGRLYISIAIWVPVFLASSIITYYALPSNAQTASANKIEINETIFMILYIISMMSTPLYVYQIFKVAMTFGTEDFLYNLRILAVSGEGDATVSLLKYVNGINQSLFIIVMWRAEQTKKFILYSVIAANILCSIAIMEKTSMSFLLLVTLFVFYEKKRVKIRTIALWGAIIILASYGFNFVRKSVADTTEMSFVDFFNIYILSPSVAYERVQENLNDQFGNHTFAFFYAFLTKTGLGSYEVETKLQEFVWVPLPTNVYTVFQPFYEDFGYKGIAFFATLYGTISGWLYRQMKNRNALCMCIYAYMVLCLLLQFFQENLLISLSLLIQYIIIMGLCLQQAVGIRFHLPLKRQHE